VAIDLAFRRKAVRPLTNEIGCSVLCDLDQAPIYVGQSVDGIHSGPGAEVVGIGLA
jgi:hypothetical protein